MRKRNIKINETKVKKCTNIIEIMGKNMKEKIEKEKQRYIGKKIRNEGKYKKGKKRKAKKLQKRIKQINK